MGMETAEGNPRCIAEFWPMSSVSSETRRGVLSQVLRPWQKCGYCAQAPAIQRPHRRTKQPHSFERTGSMGVLHWEVGTPWVAVTTA